MPAFLQWQTPPHFYVYPLLRLQVGLGGFGSNCGLDFSAEQWWDISGGFALLLILPLCMFVAALCPSRYWSRSWSMSAFRKSKVMIHVISSLPLGI